MDDLTACSPWRMPAYRLQCGKRRTAETVGTGIHDRGTGGYPGGIDDADRGGKKRGDEADLCR